MSLLKLTSMRPERLGRRDIRRAHMHQAAMACFNRTGRLFRAFAGRTDLTELSAARP
jgi:hypothetical protein